MSKKTLPQVLLLKRKFIQKFPNGIDVGLYYSEELKQYFSVPLQDSLNALTKESIIETLTKISETDEISEILFEDSSELNINKECADIVLEYINEHLDEDITSSDKAFLDILSKATNIEKDQENQG